MVPANNCQCHRSHNDFANVNANVTFTKYRHRLKLGPFGTAYIITLVNCVRFCVLFVVLGVF